MSAATGLDGVGGSSSRSEAAPCSWPPDTAGFSGDPGAPHVRGLALKCSGCFHSVCSGEGRNTRATPLGLKPGCIQYLSDLGKVT